MAEEVKSALTTKLWVTLIVISAVMSFVGVLTAPFAPRWAWCTIFGSFTAPLVTLFIVLVISKIASPFTKALTPQKLALLYTVTAMSVVFCWSMIPYGIVHNAVNMRFFLFDWHPGTTAVAKQIVFGPLNRDAVLPILTGGVSTPWGDWAPFLGWWLAYTVLWLLFWVGWLALLQERWIEVEKLPFPAALTGTMQIGLATKSEKMETEGRLKFFMLGFVIGAVVILPVIARALNRAIPDLYGWTATPYVEWFLGTISVGNLPAFRAIPVWSFLPVNPMIYALFYLFPAKILFSIWFFSLVGVLIPSQLAYYMGYYTALAEQADRFHGFMGGEPFKWIGVWIGSFVGLILTWFALNLSYMRSLLRKPVEPEKKAIPYMLGLLMIVVSTVALIALLLVAGVHPLGTLIIVFTMWVLYLSTVRVYGFASITGTAWGSPIDWSHYPFLLKHLFIPDPRTRNAVISTTMQMGNRWTGELMGENNTQWGMVFAIPMCYKVGYDTGTHPRDITKLVLVSGIISALIGYPTAVWFGYAYGTNNTPMALFDAWWLWTFDQPWGDIATIGANEPLWPHIIAGIVLTLVLSVLNFRFLWWPLDPAGVALALGAAGTGWLIPGLLAWVVKTLVLRTGGTKLNDRVVTPIVVGLLVGYWFITFLGAFLGLIQFFLPK